MDHLSVSPGVPTAVRAAGPPRHPWYSWRRIGLNFLTISIAAHFLFGLGATYLIVQTIQAKRKQTFAGPASGPNAPTRAIEHKVQMQKKQQTMSAPAPVKRITTTSNSRVALPALPAMPRMESAVTPLAMAGMGGTGVTMGMGSGGGSGGGSGSGGGLSFFGLREGKAGTLKGTFFDLKQTPGHQPTDVGRNYEQLVGQYVQGGMNDGTLASRYFKGPNPLYATQIFIPRMSANEGPKAFNLAALVKPSHWIVHYKGSVVAPESGTYRFVGVCDDVLVVRFDGRLVLDCGSIFPTGQRPTKYYAFSGMEPMIHGWCKGCGEGSPFTVEAGKTYPVDIVIGEFPGGEFKAFLQVIKEGGEYKKDTHGNPILPLFQVASGKVSAPPNTAPVFKADGPIWRGVAAPAEER